MYVYPQVVIDGAGEFTGEEWLKQLRLYYATKDVTEANHQNQNFVERNIQTAKGTPESLWCFVADYGIDIWNHLANKSLTWRTPIEVLTGHTLISLSLNHLDSMIT